MAILQVITAKKAGSAFATMEEAQTVYTTDAQAGAIRDKYIAALNNLEFNVEVDLDVDTQTLRYQRTWDEAAYNTFSSANNAARASAKVNAEAAGWTVTESISTI